MTLFKDFLAKKHRLAIDAWGADEKYIAPVYQPLLDLISKEVAPKEEDRRLYPWPVWKYEGYVGRLARNILVSEYMVKEWAEHFRGKTLGELDVIAQSFALANCLKRDGLNKVMSENAKLVA